MSGVPAAGAEGFWAFSQRIYGTPGVAGACLGLQDKRGADVNLLLFACWIAGRGLGALDAERRAAADACVGPWRAWVVEPLRAARTAIKAGIAGAPDAEAAALRKAILGAEIEGERIAQAMLESLAATWPAAQGVDPKRAAAESLAGYLAALRGVPDPSERAAVAALLAAAFA